MVEQDIKNGILARLEELEPDYRKYDEEVKQGLVEPAFFVQQIDGSQRQELGRYYLRTAMFNIRFMPDPDSLVEKTACQEMASRLYEKLNTIVWAGITYRGLRLKHEIIDDVLQFFISFDIRLMREKPAIPKMNKMDQEVDLK